MTRALSAALALVATAALAADPSMNSLAPAGVQRGTETEFTITGGNLADVQEILFYTPGFTVKKLTPADNNLKALIAVAPDCQLGIHAIRIRSLGGVSNLRTFTVGNLPEVKEIEPNTLFTQPQAISPNVTVSGTIQNEDVDHFVVELKKGDRLTAELEGLRLGNTFFDPYVAILNAERFELTRSDDAALLNQDCLASIVAQEDGKYIVQVRESSFGAGSAYRLHIGTFPRPTAAFPPGGRPGETLMVRWIGDAAGPFDQQITLPAANAAGEAPIVPRDAKGEAPSPNVLRVIDLPGYIEAEPNDEAKAASSSGAAPLALNGIIDKENDIDFFKFTAKKGQQLDVRVYARRPLRSPLDSVLTVHNAQGGGIGNNDDTGGPDSYFRFNVPADAEYLVSVRDQLKAGGPDYVYRVEITENKPSLVMRLPERRQYVSTTLVVPKGNRNAVMVAAQRQNFGGDLAVTFEGLPPGMTAEAIPLTAGLSEIPVLFTAAADSQPAGALVGIVGKTVDEKLGIVGRLDQRTMLVRGQNNTDVWGHNADRMASVLSEEIPYSIEIVPPKAPLVRNGSLDLKVVAKRKEGF
ncbi:MAG TPA: PPC domain-containing protein, partial [Pirellulaceae bacterium]|nr:PPC domain-containing protein [Pirellulaceae bacterium]